MALLHSPPPTIADPPNLCAGAINLTDYLISRYEYMLQNMGLVLDGVQTVKDFADGILSIADDVFGIPNFIQAGLGLVTLQLDGLAAWIGDPDRRQQIFCSLYCIVKDGGTLSEAKWADFIDSIPDYDGPVPIPEELLDWSFNGFLESHILYDRTVNRFNSYCADDSLSCEELCTDCAEWEQVFEGGDLFAWWELFNPSSGYAGFWDEGNDWWFPSVITNPDPVVGGQVTRTALQLRIPLIDPSYVTTIDVDFADFEEQIGDYKKWYADNQDWTLDPDKYVAYTEESAHYDINKAFLNIRFDIAADASYPGVLGAFIKPIMRITLRGTGINPFL